MNHESGRSMIEMLGVLASMGVITVAAVGMISTAMRMQKRNAVNDEVLQIVTGVRQLLGEYDDFSHIDNNMIFGAIGVSNKNPYGGTYELAVDAANARQFVVTINGLGDSDCQFFTTKAWTGSVGGASGNCGGNGDTNVVRITYGE